MTMPLYWTKERCLESARKYKKRKHWQIGESSAYASSKRKGWFDECVAHMDPIPEHCRQNAVSHPGQWTFERVESLVKTYNTRRKLQTVYPGAYAAALRNGWLDYLLPKRTTKTRAKRRETIDDNGG